MQHDKLTPGFHGDTHLLRVVHLLANRVKYFIETGTNIGITLNYFANAYPEVTCLSCEPNESAWKSAAHRIQGCANATVFNESSQRFLQRLRKNKKALFRDPALFWLDAHGHGFTWPLREEIACISRHVKEAFVLIDDFRVPGKNQFNFNAYKTQQCSFDYVKGSIDSKRKYRLYYPNYTDHTSPFHPLVGWGLLQFGSTDNLSDLLPKDMQWVH